MLAKSVINRLLELGHFRNPLYPNGFNVKRSGRLTLKDQVVKDAVASFQDMMVVDLEMISKSVYNERAAIDGIVGPATEELLRIKRCGCPDYPDLENPQEALNRNAASASWPLPCAKSGIKFTLNKTAMPASLRASFDNEVLAPVVSAYGKLGLKLVAGGTNIAISFRYLSGSTIGLAEFNNGSCGDSVFCYLDSDFAPNAATEAALLCHELGHNCNLEHTRGGIMNPSLSSVTRFDGWLTNDPSYPTLVKFFGGEPIGNDPTIPPTTPISIAGTVELQVNGKLRKYRLAEIE